MALIVELFGPPGSGKTTFAQALAGRLRAAGFEVGVHLSARPGEAGGSAAAGWSRIARPIWQLAATRTSATAKRKTDPAERLAPFLAAFGRLKRLRLRQYLYRLSAAWVKGEARPGVFILDQGYLQFVATLLAERPEAAKAQVSEALSAVPLADVSLCVEAPAGDLARRLDARLRNAGALGRWLEAGAGSSKAYGVLSDLMWDELESRGAIVLRTKSPDDDSFQDEIERASAMIERVRGKAQRGCASQRAILVSPLALAALAACL